MFSIFEIIYPATKRLSKTDASFVIMRNLTIDLGKSAAKWKNRNQAMIAVWGKDIPSSRPGFTDFVSCPSSLASIHLK